MTRSTRPTSAASTSSSDLGARPSARCAPIEPRRRRGRTGRGSRLWASAWSCRPEARPSSETSVVLGEARDLADGRDADVVQPLEPSPARLPRAARPGADGGRRARGSGGTTSSPSGFATPLADLGEELRPGDADGDRQADPLAHVGAQPHGDLASGVPASRAQARGRRGTPRRSRAPRRAASCRRRPGRRPCSPRRRPTCAARRRSAPGQRRRAAPDAHRRADAVGLRLVARREHDPAADDHGPAAQARVVALLDRREERVDVGVQDRRPRRSRSGRFGKWQHGQLGRRTADEAVEEQQVLGLLGGQRLALGRSPARGEAGVDLEPRAPAGRERADRADAPPRDEERLPPAGLDRRSDQAEPRARAAARAGAGARRRARAPRSGRAAGPPPRSAGSRPGGRAVRRRRGSGPPSRSRSSSVVACSSASARAASDACRRLPIGPSGVGCLGDDELARRGAAGRRRAPSGGCASSPAARARGSAAAPRARPRARSRARATRSARARAAPPRPTAAGARSGSTSAAVRAGRARGRRRAPARGGRGRGRRPAGSGAPRASEPLAVDAALARRGERRAGRRAVSRRAPARARSGARAPRPSPRRRAGRGGRAASGRRRSGRARRGRRAAAGPRAGAGRARPCRAAARTGAGPAARAAAARGSAGRSAALCATSSASPANARKRPSTTATSTARARSSCSRRPVRRAIGSGSATPGLTSDWNESTSSSAAHAHRADLADPVARGREPGRLEVEDDELGLLEQRVAGLARERDGRAAADDAAVAGGDLVEQRAGEAVGDRRRREERPRRLDRR